MIPCCMLDKCTMLWVSSACYGDFLWLPNIVCLSPFKLTSLKRPLVVIHDLFDKSIMDISWWVKKAIVRPTTHALVALFLRFYTEIKWFKFTFTQQAHFNQINIYTVIFFKSKWNMWIKTFTLSLEKIFLAAVDCFDLLLYETSLVVVWVWCLCVCQDSDRSGDVGLFDGRNRSLSGLFTGWTGRSTERGGEGERHIMSSHLSTNTNPFWSSDCTVCLPRSKVLVRK